MNYSTVALVKDEAGFADNANITTGKVQAYLDAATSHVNGILGRRYTIPLAETPKILELIERYLAAGFLMLDEYGQEAEGTDKDGQAKIDWAEEKLKQIEEGTLKLIGADSAELANSEVITMTGKPDDSTSDEDTSMNPQIFKIDHEF